MQAGDYYLILQVDQDWWEQNGHGRQLETNEENNELAVPIQITTTGLIDLQPTSFTAAPSADLTTGQSIDLSWTVRNNGSDTAVGQWPDVVFLSDDSVLDSNDMEIGDWQWRSYSEPLTAGEEYTHECTFAIPTSVQSGTYFLIVATDWDWVSGGFGRQLETNEANNQLAVQIVVTEIAEVDLATTILTAVPSNGLRTGQQISVSWTVTNNGSNAVVGNWPDVLFLSTDSTLDYNDWEVSDWNWSSGIEPLAAGEEYSRNLDLHIPTAFTPGVYYLILAVDYAWQGPDGIGCQLETDEHNNTISVEIEIAEAASLDLEIQSLSTTPSSGATGRPADGGTPVRINALVRNNGPDSAAGTWTTAFNISTNGSSHTSEDVPIIYYYHDWGDVVSANETVNIDLTAWLPTSAAPGQYFIEAVLDSGNEQLESNENNNTTSVGFEVTGAASVDLEPAAITPASGSVVPLDEDVEFSFTFVNNGPAAVVSEELEYAVYVSRDALLEPDGPDDIRINTSRSGFDRMSDSQNGLPPGSNVTFTFPITIYSYLGIVGDIYLFVLCDSPDLVLESNEGNNTFGIPVTLQPGCMESEPNSDISNASGPLNLDEACFGEIDGSGDVDLFAFDYEIGYPLAIYVRLQTASAELSFDVIDTNGVVVVQGVLVPDSFTGTQTMLYAPFLSTENSGTAYVRVQGSDNRTVPYEITVTELPRDPEPNDTISDAYSSGCNTGYPSICWSLGGGSLAGDRDIDFSIMSPPFDTPDHTYLAIIYPSTMTETAPFDATVMFHTSNGVQTGESVHFEMRIEDDSMPLGSAWADVSASEKRFMSIGTGNPSQPLFYSSTTAVLPRRGAPDAYESNNALGESSPLVEAPLVAENVVSMEINASLDGAGDRDFFSVVLKRNQFLHLQITAISASSPLYGSVVVLYDAGGNLLTQNDFRPGSAATELFYAAPLTGVYHIGIAPWPAEPDHPETRGFAYDVQYELGLTITTVQADDYSVLGDCLAGPNIVLPPVGCTQEQFEWMDIDGDGDVDVADFALFQFAIDGMSAADLNHDGEVNLSDYAIFASCAEGPSSSLPGDCNLDGVVDSADYSEWNPCLIGPKLQNQSGCRRMDLDSDQDVDLVDFAIFQTSLGNELAPLLPDCIDADMDGDRDVDLIDFAVFQHAFSGIP